MRILLVTPPARRPQRESIVVPPLGLMYIATVLRQAGFDVQLKDAFAEGLDWDAFGAFIRDAAPDVLGISGMSPVIDTTFRAVQLARPHVRHVVLGGPHASLYRAQVFQQCQRSLGMLGAVISHEDLELRFFLFDFHEPPPSSG